MPRYPYVAGTFYPNNRKEIISMFSYYRLKKDTSKKKLDKSIAAIIPHAGYIYSGKCAAQVYNELLKLGKPDHIVIMCPNHTGYGSGLCNQNFLTPLGEVNIDKYINKFQDVIQINNMAHLYEHAIEVHLPFLQYIYGDITIIPIVIDKIVPKMVNILKEMKRTLIIASSDFIHYGDNFSFLLNTKKPIEEVKRIDEEAYRVIKNINYKEFHNFVKDRALTICGLYPITNTLNIMKSLGAKQVEKICHYSSYDISKDDKNFVDYMGIIIK